MDKFIEKIRSWSRFKQIALLVCAFHFLALFSLLIHHWMHRQARALKPIVVRTVVPQMATPVVKAPVTVQAQKPVVKKETAKKEVPKKEVVEAPKSNASKPIAKAKSEPLPAPKKLIVPKDESLLKEIAGHLEAMQEAKAAVRKELPVPARIEAKALETKSNALPTYGAFLIGYLQEMLELPEYGDVKIRLEIDRFGRLLGCEILEAKSDKNAEFLRNRLPELTFPCLNDFDILETAQTFTITFRNVETR